MMKKLLFTALLFTLIACQSDAEIEVATYSLADPACEACARIELQYPMATGKNRKERKINASLNRWVIRAIDLSPDQESATVEEAVAEFRKAYQKIKNDFPDDYTLNWESTIDGEICYEDDQLLVICMETYSYTGGAHGYGSSHYLLFSKTEGEMIDTPHLVQDQKGFMALAEKKFRAQYRLDDASPLNEQGFMFEGDRFHLPENIGYTSSGLKLIYNPYEIAPYSEGQIIIDIPYEEVNNYLRFKGKSRL